MDTADISIRDARMSLARARAALLPQDTHDLEGTVAAAASAVAQLCEAHAACCEAGGEHKAAARVWGSVCKALTAIQRAAASGGAPMRPLEARRLGLWSATLTESLPDNKDDALAALDARVEAVLELAERVLEVAKTQSPRHLLEPVALRQRTS